MHYLNSSNLLDAPERYDRLRRTRLLSGTAMERWQASHVAVIGAGNIGSRFAPEIVRSGASVVIIDPEIGCVENLGTQAVISGVAKAAAVQQACDEILPGRAQAWLADVRHVGPGQLAAMDLLVDATDDPDLTWPLTMLSNGLGRPLMRLAVDGSGEQELGRVAVSHGGGDHACAACSYAVDDISGPRRRQPCPGDAALDRPDTVASGAIGMAIAGLGVLQAIRLVTGNSDDQALDREVLLDLTGQQMFSVRLPRSKECLTGHAKWSLAHLPCSAGDVTLVELFDLAAAELGDTATLEPFGHPLWTTAVCACGARRAAVGSRWSPPAACPACGEDMRWLPGSLIAQWTRQQAIELGLGERSLVECGLPPNGAMLVARGADRPPVRLVLA